MEDIKVQLEEAGYDYAIAVATQAEIEAGAACGQLSIIIENQEDEQTGKIMYWPLKDSKPMFPDEPGRFAFRRRHDYHTGVDLYCELGQEVIAVEDGVVITVEDFTGVNAECPWWNDTKAILILGERGVINYAEVTPLVEEGDEVKAGQVIAVVDTAVLKSFKGRPMVMLHLELLTPDTDTSPWWHHQRPKCLRDPEPLLREIAGEDLTHFDLSQYDGERYKDPNAPTKDSQWWAHWKDKDENLSQDFGGDFES